MFARSKPIAQTYSGEGLIGGFSRRRLHGSGVEIDALVGGAGPPLLLLHGFPQTRMIFKAIAPVLAANFTVVVPDLRGYGRSEKPPGDDDHMCYSKRRMAFDQIEVMRELGYERFAVAGHDRGARVAYRLALDHPQAIARLAVLDIIPTAAMWARADAAAAMSGYHWYMLAQPAPLPERLVGGDPEFFLRWTLASWAAPGFTFDPESLADYVGCFSDAASIHAACEDYRAGWTCDREHDEADRNVRTIDAPLLVLCGAEYGVARTNPVDVWRVWASDVRGVTVAGGHFVCEESPQQTSKSLLDFFTENP